MIKTKLEENLFLVAQETEMARPARHLLSILGSKRLVFLSGELGSGKTRFVQALARLMAVSERVVSPTFTIIHPYSAGKKFSRLIHIDCYRLSKKDTVITETVEEYLFEKENLVVVEWPERLVHWPPGLTIKFSFGGKPSERLVKFL